MDSNAEWVLLLSGTELKGTIDRRAKALASRVSLTVPFPPLDAATLPGVWPASARSGP